MKDWHRALGLLWLSLTPAAFCLGQTAGGRAQQPAVAYTVDGSLYLATASGQVVQKVEAELPLGDFAISPDLKKVVFSPPHPDVVGGPLFVLDVSSGEIDRMMPDPYLNDDSVAGDFAEFYTDPEFSPDDTQVVFATHAYGEGDELQLSGPLAFLNIETREVSILRSTVASDGFPFGDMRSPHWSPDGKQILGNMEGHAFVTSADGQVLTELMIPESELSQAAESYGMYAIGWLGSGCILYQAGAAPGRDPVRIFELATQKTSPAAGTWRLPEESLRGVRRLSGQLRMSPDAEGYRVAGPDGSWLIRGDPESTFARLLPQRADSTFIPAECR
jgi:hypothetical protein